MNNAVGRVLLSFAATLLMAGGAVAGPQTVAYGPAGTAQTLDLYKPATIAPTPLVMFVHGGGFTQGDKAGGWHVAKPFTQMGYTVASINYRLLGQGSLGDAATDVANAAAFLLAHARDYGIDPRRFALIGHSAGGHLVALVGTDPGYARAAGLDISHLAAVITLDGVFDLTQHVNRNRAIDQNPEFRRQMSPVMHVGDIVGHPMFCLVHEDTSQFFVQETEEFAQALRTHGQAVTIDVAPGLKHGPLLSRFDDPGEPMAQQAADCLRKAL